MGKRVEKGNGMDPRDRDESGNTGGIERKERGRVKKGVKRDERGGGWGCGGKGYGERSEPGGGP